MSIKDFFGNILSKVRNYGFLRRCRELRQEFDEAYVLAQQRKFEREYDRRRSLESADIIATKHAADNKQ